MVVDLIVREVLLLVGGSIAATVPLAVLGSHLVRSQLFGVSTLEEVSEETGISRLKIGGAISSRWQEVFEAVAYKTSKYVSRNLTEATRGCMMLPLAGTNEPAPDRTV
jgi:hypothetical protein